MPSLDETLSIDTPENVAFGYDVAGIGSRFLAGLVDSLLIVILQVLVIGTMLLILLSLGVDSIWGDSAAPIWLIAIFGLVAFAFQWGYYIYFEMAWNGQSPGKRWVGLRVIRTDGTPITLTESIIRNLVRVMDFLPAYYGVGIVTMFVNAQSRRLGDLAAGTVVVRDRGSVTLSSLAEANRLAVKPSSLRPITASTNGLPVERLTPQDVQLAESFLQRREQLANQRPLARQILAGLFARMGLPSRLMSDMEVDDWLVAIVKASRERER